MLPQGQIAIHCYVDDTQLYIVQLNLVSLMCPALMKLSLISTSVLVNAASTLVWVLITKDVKKKNPALFS